MHESDQSENKEIGGRGAKLGGGAKTFGGGPCPPPAPPLATGLYMTFFLVCLWQIFSVVILCRGNVASSDVFESFAY